LIKFLQKALLDEKGAVTTVEMIGYTILILGAATLVGFGITTALRGLSGSVIKEIKEADPNN
jgi:hypothetical protein